MEECDVLIDIIQQRRQIIGSKIKEGKVSSSISVFNIDMAKNKRFICHFFALTIHFRGLTDHALNTSRSV